MKEFSPSKYVLELVEVEDEFPVVVTVVLLSDKILNTTLSLFL